MNPRSESGVTLIELLVVIALMVVVLSATFAALDSFGIATRANMSQNQAQSSARTGVDRMAKDLRNIASPGLPNVPIERATATDLVFDTVDPFASGGGGNKTQVARVRYCLDLPSNRQKTWKQVQVWSSSSRPGLPSTTDCPASAFGTQSLVADYVVNQSGTSNRRLFTYDSATLSEITSITIELFVDTDLTRAPGEQRLSTTVYVRNANRSPTASFTTTETVNQHVLLNGSESSDPDGDDLTFTWYDGATQIGTGPIFDYASATAGSHTFTLTVTDPNGLSSSAPAQTIDLS